MRIIRPSVRSDVPRFRPVDKHRRAVGVSVVVASLLGIGGAAWAFGINAEGEASAGCVRELYVAPPAQPTLVNVFNSTQQAGFATQVAAELRTRGFQIGQVGNDPLRRKIRGTGELRTGPEGNAQVQSLQAWEAGMNVIRESRRVGGEVDYVIGERFAGLNPAAQAPPWIELTCVPQGAAPQPPPQPAAQPPAQPAAQ